MRDIKISQILKICEKHRITAYEIAANTKLDAAGIQRILNRETKKPRETTLNKILQYLETRIVGKEIPGSKNYLKDRTEITNKAAEDESPYILETNILSSILRLEKFLIKRHQNITSNHEKLSDALLVVIKDTEDILNKIDLNHDTTESSIDRLSTLVTKRLG